MSPKLRAFIFNRITIALAIAVLVVSPQIIVAQSCTKESKTPAVYTIPGVTSAMRLRANQFQKAIETRDGLGLRSSVYIYASTTIKKYIDNPKDLVDKLVILGFTDVYLSFIEYPHSLSIPKMWYKTFNKFAHINGIKVHSLSLSDFELYVSDEPIKEDVDLIKKYNKSVNTSLNTVGGDGPLTSFQPQGWDNLITSLKYILAEAKKFESFRGVDVFEFNGLEIMWESK